MPDLLVAKITAMTPADVMSRAITFFHSQNWRLQSQSGSFASFVRMTRVSSRQLLMATLLTLCLIVPGVIYYFLGIRGTRRQQNIAVSLKPYGERCEVQVTYPPGASTLIIHFLADLV